MHLNKYLKNFSILFFVFINLSLFFLSYQIYIGNKFFYLVFCITIISYVFYAFKKSNLFLDITLSIFIWLGFFFKLSIILITNTSFPEGGGNFSYTPNDYDKILIYSFIGVSAIIFSSVLFNILSNKYLDFSLNEKYQNILINFYRKEKKKIQLFFLLVIIIIFFINSYFGYYQKGLLPKQSLNIFLGYLIKWFLLFGLTSISCLLIEYDLKTYKKISLTVISLFFLELFLTNLTLLSRAMVFTGGAVLFSIYCNYRKNLSSKNYKNSFEINTIVLMIIFFISIFPVNKLRHNSFIDQNFIAKKILENYENSKENSLISVSGKKNIFNENIKQNDLSRILKSKIDDKTKIKIIENDLSETNKDSFNLKKNLYTSVSLIRDRFIGVDALAAVTSYPEKNFKLIELSLKEKFNAEKFGFYQRIFIIPFEQPHLVDQKYTNTSKRHYGVIIPGIIGYLSYPGSKLFLFFSLSLFFIFCASLEVVSRKLSFNSKIFSNFVGYVLAYRLIHFGYLPRQTYLLVCAILLTLVIVYLLKKIIILNHESSKNL